MSVTSKVALSWILIGNTFEGLKELGVKSEPFDHTFHDWRLIQIIISAVCGVILIGGITIITRRNGANNSRSDTVEGNQMRQMRKKFNYKEVTHF